MKRSVLSLALAPLALWAAEKANPTATNPVLIKSVAPQYSVEGRLVSAQGRAVLDVLIDETGRVGDVRVEQSLGFGLDEEAAAAVRGWRFQPASKDGTAVPVRASIEVDFRLNEGDSARRWLVHGMELDVPEGFKPPEVRQGQVPANTAGDRSSGRVVIRFHINETGRVENVSVAGSTETAEENQRIARELASWQFRPATRDGQAG